MSHESDKGNDPKEAPPDVCGETGKWPGKKLLRKSRVKKLAIAVVCICLWASVTAFCVSADGKHIGDSGFIQAWCGFGIVLLGATLVWTAVLCFFAPRWVEQRITGTQGAEGAIQRIFGIAVSLAAVGLGLIGIAIFAFDLLK